VRDDLFDGKLDRLNPGFGGINFRTLGTSTSYNSGQFQLNRRYANGVTAQMAYTYAKAIDTGSDVQVGGLPVDARALYLERGVTDFNIAHRFAGSVLWEMPFFKQAKGISQVLLGGWQVNMIVSLQTGFPFTVYTSRPYGAGGGFNGDGNNNDRPNTPSFGNTITGVGRQEYLRGLFKASQFPITGFVLGDLGRNTFRDQVTRPRTSRLQELQASDHRGDPAAVPCRVVQCIEPDEPAAPKRQSCVGHFRAFHVVFPGKGDSVRAQDHLLSVTAPGTSLPGAAVSRQRGTGAPYQGVFRIAQFQG
jgi:hypothetical protein